MKPHTIARRKDLRDEYAMAALQGMLTGLVMQPRIGQSINISVTVFAAAFDAADGMMQERIRRKIVSPGKRRP